MGWKGVWIVGGIAAAALAVAIVAIVVIYAGTYASYFLHAATRGRSGAPPSPVTAACALLAHAPGGKVRVRFTFSNQTNVEATAITFYLTGIRFDPPIAALGDPVLTTVNVRMPAKATIDAIRTVEQPSTISVGRKITALGCDVYHVGFADGSEWQLPSTGANDDFP